jgi:hypothetical protein
MEPDLYFLSVLDTMLKGPDLKRGAVNALGKIDALSDRPTYRHGHSQFLSFMESSAEAYRKHSSIREILLDSLEVITLVDEEKARQGPQHIAVWRDGKVLTTIALPAAGSQARIREVTPGRFRLFHSGGWLLWDGELTENNLLLGLGNRTKLQVAASTDTADLVDTTLSFPVAGDEIIVSVQAGVHAGTVTITRSRE